MIRQWLATPTQTTSGKVANILAAFAINILWVILIFAVFVVIMPRWVNPIHFRVPKTFPSADDIFFTVLMAPLWEELAFRYVPYRIAQWFELLMRKIDYLLLDKKLLSKHLPVTANFALMIPIMVCATLIFGWGHGNGTISLLIQGVGGLLLSIVYIKNNYSYWSSVTLHAMWNTLCYFIV